MQDTETVAAPSRGPRSRLDLGLTIAAWVLAAAVLALAGWLGYSVWASNNAENLSTPALRAIHDLKIRVTKTPNDAALRVRLGEALGAAGLYDESVTELSQAIKIDPKHTGAYLDLGLVAVDQGQSKAAQGYFKKVVDLTTGVDYEGVNQRRETALYYLGKIALDEKRFDEAAGYFKAALRIRRDASDTYYNLALAYRGMGDLNAALKNFEIALAYDPNYAQAHYEMGQLYLQKKDTINAAVHLAAAAKLAPDADPPKEALATLGTAASWRDKATKALAANNIKAAVDDILVARALEPENVALAKLHGAIAEKKGDKKAALQIYKEAVKLGATDPETKAAIKRLGG